VSWAALPVDFRALCKRELTPEQFEVYWRWEDDLTYEAIALELGIATSTVRGRLDRSVRRLEALCQLLSDPSGVAAEPCREASAGAA
jgi:DNA-directed RNA polymerase specialized sigma24 family protein